MNSVALHGFQSLVPPYSADQAGAFDWIAAAHARSDIAAGLEPNPLYPKLARRFGCPPELIKTRHTVLEDFMHQDWARMRIFDLRSQRAGAPAGERSQVYAEAANEALRRFYPEQAQAPGALIHVTCTGYVAPSAAQRIIAERGWGASTQVIHAYHMGCYAAFPATRMAQALLKSGEVPDRGVDLVHTELCTLHFDPSDHAPEQFVIQSLFADGMIRYRASRSEEVADPALEIEGHHEEIFPDSAEAMTWTIAGHGMRMGLARSVPDQLSARIGGFVDRLLSKHGKPAEHENALFAIHPGGPKIIDRVAEALRLSEKQIAASRKTLAQNGNMSSATLPHVWKEILDDPRVPGGTHVISLAFGPGLTVSGGLLRKTGPAP